MDTSTKISYTLYNGVKIPKIALGTGIIPHEQTKQAIRAALECGYRQIDTASSYNNEEEIGEAVQEYLASSDSSTTRSDLFITTKVWGPDHASDKVKAACKESLRKLKIDYIDLYLIHSPVSGTMDFEKHETKLSYIPIRETWRAMEELVEQGLVKSIGVSNFNVQLLLDLFSYARIKPMVLQVEMHPFLPQNELLQWCKQQDILVQAYSPLGLATAATITPNDDSSFVRSVDREEITKIATRLGKTPAQVILAWGMARRTVVLPRSSQPDRIRENFGATTFLLEDDDVIAIDNIKERRRIYDIGKLVGVPVFN
mmetsp:Transcript_59799/g.68014  ORF Transcript_59799/g.68014 Transcript_59799/m.68014 type:complete len:314 (+) Transcript_59799:41-982(+)|eukprot:CAMPEP_0115007230 /NCGR_PEP_ID=MMETSP0216-20121206/21037_1 /TAXON_ID=223996 /ORGANISM="Protocruzia adherens, Strain Boccale" /LENGTH=313 /DNA_ID=CAMNT_0002374095 /DNA_START=39 /DNA_END=980 /DNA_ORIENTATION=+